MARGGWAVELVSHLVFAQPDNAEAREIEARALEQLAYGSENGTWRNFFLMGAHELREDPGGTAASLPPDFIASLTNEQVFDALAVQIDGPQAGDRQISLHWRFTDTGDEYHLTLQHGVLTHRPGAPKESADATVTTERSALNEVIAGSAAIEAVAASGRLSVDGDQTKLGELLGLLDPPDPNFRHCHPMMRTARHRKPYRIARGAGETFDKHLGVRQPPRSTFAFRQRMCLACSIPASTGRRARQMRS